MKRYIPIVEDVEIYKARHPLLAEMIRLHNLCDNYHSKNETHLHLKDYSYLKHFIDLYSNLYIFIKEHYKELFQQYRIKGKDSYIKQKLNSALIDLNILKTNFDDLEALNGYSYLHEIIQFFIEYDYYFEA